MCGLNRQDKARTVPSEGKGLPDGERKPRHRRYPFRADHAGSTSRGEQEAQATAFEDQPPLATTHPACAGRQDADLADEKLRLREAGGLQGD